MPPATQNVVSDSVKDDGPPRPLADRLLTTFATLELSADGPYAINKPIRIRASVRGQYSVSDARVSIDVKGGGKFTSGETSTTRMRSTSLSEGQEFSYDNEVVFSQPGYYQVIAAAAATDPRLPRTKGDSVLLPSVQKSAWIYVGESSGKFDKLFDTSMLQREESVLRYGSYGQFKLKSEPKNPLRGANARTDVRTQVGLAASMMSDPVMTGVLTYTSSDSATFGQQIVIPGASIQGYCKVGSTNVYYYSTGTNSAGQFSIACPAGSTSYGGVAKLESPAARIAYGFLNLWLDFPLDIDANVTDTISVIPEMGAVYRYHQIYNLQATTEFLRTRGQMKYVVNPGSNAASKYDTGSDWIQINAGAYWDAFGHFATPHEFGHAFHYTAIDRWRSSSYSCVDNDHGFHTFETTSCAYVEGFADFFAFWMLRNESPTYQFWTNGSIEFNSNPATPPVGIIVEFYFAATLWDMVDDASMSDGIGGDDDGVAITPRDIADIMLKCRLISPNEYLISHTDQFVYCAEYGVNNAAFSLPTTHRQFWGAYGSMTWDGGAPVLPNLTAFRNLWRLNFYAL